MKLKTKHQMFFSALFCISLYFLLITLIGCGDSPQHSTPASSEIKREVGISVKAVLGAPPSNAYRKSYILEPPSGDICTDYKVETIRASLVEPDGDYNNSSSVPCINKNVRFENCPVNTKLKLILEGIVEGNPVPQWRKEITDINLSTGEDRNLGVQILEYIGDDDESPVVDSVSPEDNQQGVATNTDIIVEFSEDVIPASIEGNMITLINSDNETIPCTYDYVLDYNESDHQAVFTPQQELAPFVRYTVSFDGAEKVSDRSGNIMATEIYTWDFVTFDQTSTLWYVDPNIGNATSDCGDTWGNACIKIQDAIQNAERSSDIGNHEIWMKRGVHTLIERVNISEAIRIYGGFVGNETRRYQRDTLKHPTIIEGKSEQDCFKITGEATIDGLIIKNCKNGFVLENVEQGTALIQNCTISDNARGIQVSNSAVELINCVISDNNNLSIVPKISTYRDTGIEIVNSNNVFLINCTIAKNECGGAYIDNSLSVEIINTIIWDNYGNCNNDDSGLINDFPRVINSDVKISNSNIVEGVFESYDIIVEDGGGNLSTDPLLTRNYHLTSSSPCIDQGSSSLDLFDVFPIDIDGEDRGTGLFDIGADEFINTDNDGLPDYWERKYDLNVKSPPDDPDDDKDPDYDNILNIDEYEDHLDPAHKTVSLDFEQCIDFWDGEIVDCNSENADLMLRVIFQNIVLASPHNNNTLIKIPYSVSFDDVERPDYGYATSVSVEKDTTYLCLDSDGLAYTVIKAHDYYNRTFSYERFPY